MLFVILWEMMYTFILITAVADTNGCLNYWSMSGKRVELGIVPIGALGMTIAGIYVGSVDVVKLINASSLTDFIQHSSNIKILLGLLMLSISGGLFVVPLYAYLQSNTPQEYLSRNIAALNIMNAGFMIIAGIFAIVMGIDSIDYVKIIAMLLIFSGVYLVSYKQKQKALHE